MKVYIAGSITNNENYIEQFKKAEVEILKAGDAPLNPVKNLGFEYKDYIDMGLCELMKCDAIYLLKGWEKSAGARLEEHYARVTNMQMIYQTER